MPTRPPNAKAKQSAASAKRYDKARSIRDAKRWHDSARWKRIRADQLRREPLCWMCRREGAITPATICDHEDPHRGDEASFWLGPFRSLCHHHHVSTKQREETQQLVRD